MKIDIVSVFPEYFEVMNLSLMGKAQAKGLLEIKAHNLRDWTHDVHHSVDDTPVGGGAGMVMKPEPIFAAIEALQTPGCTRIYMCPDGEKLSPKIASELSRAGHLIILSGHYEGIDQRIRDCVIDREISIGDYVLTNGCLLYTSDAAAEL